MRALVFGSLNLDYVYQLEHFAQAGETISSSRRDIFCGGKGLNQSIALSRSGAEVWHAGAIGAADGKMLVDALEQAGVRTELVQRKEMPTGHAIIQTVPDGENCIILFGGANQSITAEETVNALAQFSEGDLLILQNEINGNAFIMEEAKKRGMKIALNPSPMDEKILSLPLDLVDFLILNEVEGAAMAQEKQSAAQENSDPDGDALMDALLAKFPGAEIVLTLGKNGSIYGHGEMRIHQPIYPVKAVDTTAAGDTFTGFFFGSLMRGESVEVAMDLAAKASAIAVGRPGASPSIPTIEEVRGGRALA